MTSLRPAIRRCCSCMSDRKLVYKPIAATNSTPPIAWIIARLRTGS
jgi:hypothetical protein